MTDRWGGAFFKAPERAESPHAEVVPPPPIRTVARLPCHPETPGSPDPVTPFVVVFGPVAGTGTSGTAGVPILWSYETNDPEAFFRLIIE